MWGTQSWGAGRSEWKCGVSGQFCPVQPETPSLSGQAGWGVPFILCACMGTFPSSHQQGGLGGRSSLTFSLGSSWRGPVGHSGGCILGCSSEIRAGQCRSRSAADVPGKGLGVGHQPSRIFPKFGGPKRCSDSATLELSGTLWNTVPGVCRPEISPQTRHGRPPAPTPQTLLAPGAFLGSGCLVWLHPDSLETSSVLSVVKVLRG